MTKPKNAAECPICGKTLWLLSKHLNKVHNLKNPQERAILNQLATGRIQLGEGACPLPMCHSSVQWLEKHLLGHKDHTASRISIEIKAVKRRVAIERLKALRATQPNPPMVSTLDLPDEGEEEPQECLCQKSACVNTRKRLRELEREFKEEERKFKELVREIKELVTEIHELESEASMMRQGSGPGSGTQRPAPAPLTDHKPKPVEVIDISSDTEEEALPADRV